jgi:hypothetical protein
VVPRPFHPVLASVSCEISTGRVARTRPTNMGSVSGVDVSTWELRLPITLHYVSHGVLLKRLLQQASGRKIEDCDRSILSPNTHFRPAVRHPPAALLRKPADIFRLFLAVVELYPG